MLLVATLAFPALVLAYTHCDGCEVVEVDGHCYGSAPCKGFYVNWLAAWRCHEKKCYSADGSWEWVACDPHYTYSEDECCPVSP